MIKYSCIIVRRRTPGLEATSRHVLAEFYGSPAEILNNVKIIEKEICRAALAAGAEIREVVFHKFAPQGVSGVLIISESHISIHTWPELNYASVDVYTCGTTVDPWDAVRSLKENLQAEKAEGIEVLRGDGIPHKTKEKII